MPDVLKKVPLWGWIVGAGALLVGLMVAWSRSASPAPAASADVSAPPTASPPPPAPSADPGASSADLASMADAFATSLNHMGDYMASSTAALRADTRSTFTLLDRTEQEVQTLGRSVDELRQGASSVTEPLHLWNPNDGWSLQFVKADNPYEVAVADANARYYNATTDADRKQAHDDAQAARAAAGQAGVKLDSWALAGQK